jgi:ribosomal protein L30/L7E
MSQETQVYNPLIVVKIRGLVSAQREVRETLKFLHLEHTKPRSHNRQPPSIQRHATTC